MKNININKILNNLDVFEKIGMHSIKYKHLEIRMVDDGKQIEVTYESKFRYFVKFFKLTDKQSRILKYRFKNFINEPTLKEKKQEKKLSKYINKIFKDKEKPFRRDCFYKSEF